MDLSKEESPGGSGLLPPKASLKHPSLKCPQALFSPQPNLSPLAADEGPESKIIPVHSGRAVRSLGEDGLAAGLQMKIQHIANYEAHREPWKAASFIQLQRPGMPYPWQHVRRETRQTLLPARHFKDQASVCPSVLRGWASLQLPCLFKNVDLTGRRKRFRIAEMQNPA